MTSPLTDAVAWTVVGLFAATTLLDWGDRRDAARHLGTVAWAAFGAFWLLLVPHFAFEQRSIIEGVLSLAAVPASLYTGYLLYSGRDSLLTLTRAVAVMGAVYLPAQSLLFIRRPMIEFVTGQVAFLIGAFGYAPAVETGRELGFQNMFVFVGADGHRYTTEILMACTGLGSMTIFAGLVAAVEAPLSRKFRALSIALPIIYALNVLRVTFIALAHGQQWFRREPFVEPVLFLFGASDPNRVSFFVADRILAQSLSVVALVVIAWLVVRELPELLSILEDVAYLVTGDEYDLRSALSV